jgi:hypothetical protein
VHRRARKLNPGYTRAFSESLYPITEAATADHHRHTSNYEVVLIRFNGKLQDECLKGEIFYSLKEAQVVIERWRVHYNTVRPHSSLGYRPPAPQAILPKEMGHGDMENAARFPHLHTPDYDYGVDSKKALH